MLASSKKSYFQVITTYPPTSAVDLSLDDAVVIIKVWDNQYWWLAGGYDLEIGRF